MAYETKHDGSTEKTVKIGAQGNPTSVEGYFLGSKIIPSTMKGYKDSFLHIFETGEGNVGVWGTTYLNSLLTPDLRGMMCLVEFTGMIPAKQKGMRDAYGYKVQFDKEDTISIEHINLTASTHAATEDKSGDSEDFDTSFDTAKYDRQNRETTPAIRGPRHAHRA